MDMNETAALARLNDWAGKPVPLNACAWSNGVLSVRLRGALAAVQAARARLGGDIVEDDAALQFWQGMRNHEAAFFSMAREAVPSGASLWRLSLPSTAPPLALSGEVMVEWLGAQRWLCSTLPASTVRDATAKAGGHATLFLANDKSPGVFAPLLSPLDRIHRELKRAFDPAGIFNPGRLYPGL
jgi:glycolate oxidase FAD binding subunit